MKFTIITHVEHIKNQDNYFGYAPYIREMNIWLKYVDEVVIVAPLVTKELNPIHEQYLHNTIHFKPVKGFNITSLKNIMITFFRLPNIIRTVFKAMSQADHIHLRCPGNMGLIAAFVQILFPSKQKTAKYAGNWDPKANQPFSYKVQKWILSNTFLTRNMQVLVYGDWENQTKNIKSFFTATYSEFDKKAVAEKKIEGEIKFLFVGTLSKGKQPLYVIQLVEKLKKLHKNVHLELYGEGVLREALESYIFTKNIGNFVFLKGNQSKESVEKAYQEAHFLVLPSKSEGWPKVVAEAMFWGCLPIVTKISCVPYILDNGNRGLLIDEDLVIDVQSIQNLLNNPVEFKNKTVNALRWSREFTLDKFENEIKTLILYK